MASPLFETLDALAVPARVAKGATLFRAGEDARAAYTVRSGGLALLSAVPAQFAPMQIHGAQSLVGLPGVLSGVYSVTVLAGEESEVGFIARDRILELLGSDSRLCLEALGLVARQVSRLRAMIRANDIGSHTYRLLLSDFHSPVYSRPAYAGPISLNQEGLLQ